jgi:oxygen-independent coproporphyrinogen III oxidase
MSKTQADNTHRLHDMLLEELIARYGGTVPRYTSYPTAPHFAAMPDPGSPDPGGYAARLQALPATTEVSLYLHVPFCRALCLFCGCHTTAVARAEPIAAYAANLRAEILLLARAIGRPLVVRHLHWGGGTPSVLAPEDLVATMELLAQHFSFAADAEIAVEIDPRELSDGMVQTLAVTGVTRASLGVQDFNPTVQETVHRVQPYSLVAEAVAALRRSGIGAINFDLMYGLPHQTEASVAATAEQALTLAPDRLAVFGYAHVPWLKRRQALLPEAALPDPQERYRQQQAAARVLTDGGYIAIGLDHFARPGDALAVAAAAGRLRRNFQGYTADPSPVLLGLGASAIGALPDAYVQNAAAIPQWASAVRAGRLPVVRGIVLSAEDELRRDVIEQIMCHLEVDLAATAARHAASLETILAPALPVLVRQADDGLIRWDGRRLQVTATGQPFLRSVAASFDAYYDSEPARPHHSQGV